MKKNEVNMLSGPIAKGLLVITIPIMIMNVLQNLFGVIDMTVLGNLVNDSAVGAVGACGTLISLITGLMIGVSAGANVVVARYIGRGDKENVERAIGTAIMFALVGGVVLLVIGVSLAEVLLRITNCPESLLPQATTYFRLYFVGSPILLLYNFTASILRASGDTKRPMYFLIFGGVVKVAMNFFLITVFNTTVEGVAIATIISWLIAGGLCLFILCKSTGIVRFNIKKFRFYGKQLKEILFIGIPTGLQTATYSLANVVITSTVNAVGESATKGIAIANQFDGILYQISIAPSLATMSYISQNAGVGNFKRVRQTIVRSMGIAVLFGVTFGSLSAIFSGQLSSTMSKDPVVIAFSQQKMQLISSLYFVCGINEIMGATLKGLKNPIVPTITTMLFMCAIRFPWVYFVYPLFPNNLTFLYLIWPIGWVLSIITLLIVFFPTIRKREREFEKENFKVKNGAL